MSHTHLMSEDRRPMVRIMSVDLANQDRDMVVEIRTESGSRYRLMRRPESVATRDEVTGVLIASTNRRMDDVTKRSTRVDRHVRIGRQFRFGVHGRSHTSAVESVYVGGRKVAG